MWSSSSTDLKSLDLDLGHHRQNYSDFEPTPYTFTKLEKGKKVDGKKTVSVTQIKVDPTKISPPSWLLLDHTVAVIWSMFSSNPSLHQLNIDDLKWAYEFLKEIRNRKGENPPDVKTCLTEIQDRLIYLYAKRMTLKEENSPQKHFALSAEDFDDIAAAFGDKLIADTNPSFSNMSTIMTSKLETSSLGSAFTPSRTNFSYPSLTYRHSSKDLTQRPNSRGTKIAVNYSKKTLPVLEKTSNIFELPENGEDEEVENYILSLFEDEKEDSLQTKHSLKSLIPTKKKPPTTVISEIISEQETSGDSTKKTSKKVHCVAEMRSVKFQKSMKVQDTNGEEAAYSNLKAEIRRLTINPNVSRSEIMKFLKEWRSEQVDRLHNELKRLNSIEEFIKGLSNDEVEPNLRKNSPPQLKDLDATKNKYSLCKS